MMTHHTKISRRGFTLVEVVISMFIIGTMMIAAIRLMGAAAKDRATQVQMRKGTALAQLLMSEIMMQKYTTNGSTTIGRPSSGDFSTRVNYKDVDDYYDLNESPPQDRTGTVIPGYTGWRWSAAVKFQTVPTLTTGPTAAPSTSLLEGILGIVVAILGGSGDTSSTDTGLKRIDVTVTSPEGKAQTITSFRCSTGVVDPMVVGSQLTTWSSVTINLDAGRQAIVVGGPMLNTPAP